MPYYQNRRRGGKPKTGRKLKWVPTIAAMAGAGAHYGLRSVARGAFRKAVDSGTRAAVQANAAHFRRVGQGMALGAAGAGAVGYGINRIGRKRKVVGKPKYGSTQMAEYLGQINKSVSLLKNPSYIPRTQLKLGYNQRYLRWQYLAAWKSLAGLPGRLPLNHCTNGTSTDCPLYAFCLNNTDNNTNLTVGPMFALQVSDLGVPVFTNVNCQNPDNTVTQSKWIVDKNIPDAGTTDINPRLTHIMNAWYAIKLQCYGALAQPTKYRIDIVSFDDDWIDPIENTTTNSQEARDRQYFWQSMVQSYMSTPLVPKVPMKRKYRTHSFVEFWLQPTLNTENDTTPQSRIVSMFIRDGSIYNYQYTNDGKQAAGADDLLSGTTFEVQGGDGADQTMDFPQAKARKWVIIRALNTTRLGTPGSQTSSDTPSMDVIVRKCEYTQAR